MTDIGVILVIACAVLAPWVVRLARAPAALAWPVFLLVIALLVLLLMDRVHVWLPSGIGEPLGWALALAVIALLPPQENSLPAPTPAR